MITIKVVNDITPKEFAVDKFNNDVFFQRKVYFLGIRIFRYECKRFFDTKLLQPIKNKGKKAGFVQGGED